MLLRRTTLAESSQDAKTPTTFSLTSTQNGTLYTSIMEGSSNMDGSLLRTIVSDTSSIPEPPASRTSSNADPKTHIGSVFPQMLTFKFSPTGESFVGAYQDKTRKVYAVVGEVIPDSVPGMLFNLSQPPTLLPVENIWPFHDQAVSTPPLAANSIQLDDGTSLSSAAVAISDQAPGEHLNELPSLMSVNK